MVHQHGVKFIGPSPELIKCMGDKIEAKRIASKHGLPVIQGSESGITSLNEAKKVCSSIGYPILIKASGGGGGKGMKLVTNESQLESSLNQARIEA